MFRSGFVAIVGRPNVGKSTLLNQLIGEKIAITSPVAQTTRHRIKGVVTREKGQVIFLDTPGFSKPLDSLGTLLTQEGMAALSEADVVVVVVEADEEPGKGDYWVMAQAIQSKKPTILVLNKADSLKSKNGPSIPGQKAAYLNLFQSIDSQAEPETILAISAKTGKHVPNLLDSILRLLPEGPAYYPEDALTDQRLREISAEMIREKILHRTLEELPHSVAVAIETFEEKDTSTHIRATLFVDQDSQKGILIGKNGQMIKTIGSDARQDIETLLGHAVYLELTVKVKKNWRKDPRFLKSLGLAPASN
ncbi:MAG: GTPase Era [Cyanobacteria bacterium]|nr:GTPase Era [Cyanobacteriota bacterium]